VERVVRCPFSATLEYVEDHFREVAARGGQVGVRLRDLVPTLGGRIKQPVTVAFDRRPDKAEGGRSHDAIEICWTAGTRFYPDFRGTLHLRIVTVDETRLSLEGEYRPPLGLAGRVFDRLIGRRIARATLRDLLDKLGDEMERREADYRRSGARSESGSTV